MNLYRTPAQQHARYRNASANPASNPDSQLARRLKTLREINEQSTKALRDQIALQQRQAANIRAKVDPRTRRVKR